VTYSTCSGHILDSDADYIDFGSHCKRFVSLQNDIAIARREMNAVGAYDAND